MRRDRHWCGTVRVISSSVPQGQGAWCACVRRTDGVLGKPDAAGDAAALAPGSIEYRRPCSLHSPLTRMSQHPARNRPHQFPWKLSFEYGRWFRHQLGSDLEATAVAQVSRENSNFKVTLESGVSFQSRRVVVAAGIGPFQSKPAVFAHLPPTQASHCYEGVKMADLARKRVAVVGAGQSALESAALLLEAGAEVEVIARIESLRWIGMHSWLHHLGPISQILYSKHDVGPAGISRLVANPNLVFHIPLQIKDKIRTRAVRPAGARWLPARLESVKITTGRRVQKAQSVGDEVELILDDGSERRVDHVLLGTGYRVDISRYSFLSEGLVSKVRQLDGYPEVTAGFCSSVPGLHFIGAAAARSFGPLLYFVTGTEFTSKQLASHISRSRVPVA